MLVLYSLYFYGISELICAKGIGVFQDYYQDNQLRSYSPSTVSWIPSVESFMLFFWGPVVGKIYDNYGPTWLIRIGTFLHVFGLMMTSISKKYYQIFLSQSVVSAAGASLIFYPTLSAVGTWFRKRRALAFGIMVCGSSLGGVILPIMVDHLVQNLGFGWAMRISAFLILFMLLIVNLTVKSHIPPQPRPLQIMEFLKPFTEIPFLLVAVGSFLLYFGAFLPFNYIIVQGKAAGMSSDLAQYLVPITNAASTFGRVIPGYLGDKYGVFNVFILLTAIAGILDLALWLPATSSGAIISFAALYGAASGGVFSMLPAIVAQISDIRELGPIGGAIVTRDSGGYSGLKIFAGVTLLAGVCFFIFARIAQSGLKIKVKV
ncbi:hypothetical protein B7463_g1307, partial [Scytalidium lignicola]